MRKSCRHQPCPKLSFYCPFQGAMSGGKESFIWLATLWLHFLKRQTSVSGHHPVVWEPFLTEQTKPLYFREGILSFMLGCACIDNLSCYLITRWLTHCHRLSSGKWMWFVVYLFNNSPKNLKHKEEPFHPDGGNSVTQREQHFKVWPGKAAMKSTECDPNVPYLWGLRTWVSLSCLHFYSSSTSWAIQF